MLWRMRKLLSLAVFAGIVAMAPLGYSADLSGTWKGAFDFQGQSVPLTIHLTETGAAVTGTVEGLPTTPTDIHDGRLTGDKLTFWANTDYQGQTYKLEFAGQVSSAADEISFTLATDDGSWSSGLTAHRSTDAASPAAMGPDVTGTWKGSFDFQGSSVPVTLHLVSANGTVTGTVEGMIEGSPEKPIDIQDGKLVGNTLTFWVNTQYQGETYKIVYKGTLADGKLQLGFGTEDGSWSSEMTATKN